MGEGKIRKKRPVLLALAVLQGCTLKLTKHLVPGTDWAEAGVGTEGDQGQEGTDVSLYPPTVPLRASFSASLCWGQGQHIKTGTPRCQVHWEGPEECQRLGLTRG